MGEETTDKIQHRFHLSDSFLLGDTPAAASTGQIVENGSCRPEAHLPSRTGRKNHRRRVAGPFSTSNAQVYLAARPARCVVDLGSISDERRSSPRTAQAL